jgi:hypothetical protein
MVLQNPKIRPEDFCCLRAVEASCIYTYLLKKQ